MANALPGSVTRNLSDKLYDKRKSAAVEIENIMRQLAATGDHDKIGNMIRFLIKDFVYLAPADNRKGGLTALAGVVVGLAAVAAPHLEQILPPVITSLSDQDSGVRYYACEALYNIAKVVRGDLIVFFNQIFDALCKLSADSDTNVQKASHLLNQLLKDIVSESHQFSMEEFVPFLRERINILNPLVRQFLVGWITFLDGIPQIEILKFLPEFLDGLFNFLSDSNLEIRQQAVSALSVFVLEIKNSSSVDYGRMVGILVKRAACPDEFTRLTAITWLNEFVKIGGKQLVPYYADILGAILPCISDKEENIKLFARETNEKLHALSANSSEGLDIAAVFATAQSKLSSEVEATRIEGLHWMSTLLAKHRAEVLSFLNGIFDPLFRALSDSSDEVVLLVLEIHACIARDPEYFNQLLVHLLRCFRVNNSLLEKRGALIICRLSVLLDAKRIYCKLSTILEGEADLEFAYTMVQALNLILLTSSELFELRILLSQSLVEDTAKDLFSSLYASWCHSPVATIGLCLLAQAYQHTNYVIHSLLEEDIGVKFLDQLGKLIYLLETPTFSYLRLQLLEPGRNMELLKALYGLLTLLPQKSSAFNVLHKRLKIVPPCSSNANQLKQTSSQIPGGSQIAENITILESRNMHEGVNFVSRTQQYQQMRLKHRMHLKSQLRSHNSTSSALSQEFQRTIEIEPSPTSHPSQLHSRSLPSSSRGPSQM